MPEIGFIDEPENVGGSAPEELSNDTFSLSITDDSGNKVYTVTKDHEIVFDALNGKYTFNVKTICKTTKDRKLKTTVKVQYIKSESKRIFTPRSISVSLKSVNDGYISLHTGYSKGSVDNTWYESVDAIQHTLSKFFVNYSSFDTWKRNIDNGTYKIYSQNANFNNISGYKKIGNEWRHFSYYGESLVDFNIVISCHEYNPNSNNDVEKEYTLSVPFSDNPFPVWIPKMDLSISNITNDSITYSINSTSEFYGSATGYLSLMKLVHGADGDYLSIIAGKDVALSFSQNSLPITGTISGLSLQEGIEYYLGGGTSSDTNYHDWSYRIVSSHYDLTHSVPIYLDSIKIGEKIPYNNGNLYLFPKLSDFGVPFVSDEVKQDGDIYYGGYGINAVPFEFHPTQITNVQLNSSITDIDLTGSYTGFDVSLTIEPSNWTRVNKPFTIVSSNPSAIGVTSSGGNRTTKIFNKTEETKVVFYARGAGLSNLTISTADPDFSVSLSVNVHVPTSSCDPVNYQIDTGVRTIIDLSYNTLSGKPTTDRILSIVEKSNHVKATIISDTQISVIGLPYGNDWREETIKCSVGDTFNGVERINSYFNITLEVLPMPEAISFYPSTVPKMLTFDSISQMYRNLTPIMIALNALSEDRWAEVESITKVVNVTSQYNMNFAELLTELNNLELDIKNLITPVSNYLMTKDSAYFETHTQEREIRDAISILYPQYPGQSLDSLSTASFATTLVSGSGSVNRHEFIQSRYDWCNRMIDALNI